MYLRWRLKEAEKINNEYLFFVFLNLREKKKQCFFDSIEISNFERSSKSDIKVIFQSIQNLLELGTTTTTKTAATEAVKLNHVESIEIVV